MAKKTAMVAPPPAKQTPREIIIPPGKPKLKHDLESVLHELGNDRPYTLVGSGADYWMVHFLGDEQITKIKK
jgi:hypothetical protein